MYRLALAAHFIGMKPQTKWFLVKFIQRYEGNKSEVMGLEKLAKTVGMDSETVGIAVSYLYQHEYFIGGEDSAQKQNSSRSYQCSRKIIKLLEGVKLQALSLQHEELIKSLLLFDSTVAKTVSFYRLKRVNRLLLAVLLNHADKYGVVRSLGLADLLKLTGMGIDKLEYQLTKLQKYRYVIGRVSGITGSYIFGATKGMYFLEIVPSMFRQTSGPDPIVRSIFNLQEWNLADRSFKFANVIRSIHPLPSYIAQLEAVALSENMKLPVHDEFWHLIDFFKDTRVSRVSHFLQVKLEEYASHILAESQGEGVDDKGIATVGLKEKIYLEIFPKEMRRTRLIKQQDRDLLIEYIYRLSHRRQFSSELSPLINIMPPFFARFWC